MTSRDALVHVFNAAVAAADSAEEALRFLTTYARVSRAWFAAATSAAPYRLLAVREWPALSQLDAEPACGWRRFVRALFCAKARGVPPYQRIDEKSKAKLLEQILQHRYFLDVFDIATCKLLTSVQLRAPKLSSWSSEVNFFVAEPEPAGVAPLVPAELWSGKDVRFRVTVLRTSDGAVAQLMHAAAVSESRHDGGETLQYGPRPSPRRDMPSPSSPSSDAPSDDADDGDKERLVAQTIFSVRDEGGSDLELCVNVYAVENTATLGVMYASRRSNGPAWPSIWLFMLSSLVWASPSPPQAPAICLVRSGDSAPQDGGAAAEALPREVLCRIMKQLEPHDIAAAALTCTAFAAAARTQCVWRAAMLSSVAPALARYVDVTGVQSRAAGFSWRSLAAQVWEARCRHCWHEEGSLSGVMFLLEVNYIAEHCERLALIYSGLLCRLKKARNEDDARFLGSAENALFNASHHFNVAEQFASQNDPDEAFSWLRESGELCLSIYAVRACDGAVAQLADSSSHIEIERDGPVLQLSMFGLGGPDCELVSALGSRETLTCTMEADVTLPWPVQQQSGAPLERAFSNAELSVRVLGAGRSVIECFSSAEVKGKHILQLLAHANWVLPAV